MFPQRLWMGAGRSNLDPALRFRIKVSPRDLPGSQNRPEHGRLVRAFTCDFGRTTRPSYVLQQAANPNHGSTLRSLSFTPEAGADDSPGGEAGGRSVSQR